MGSTTLSWEDQNAFDYRFAYWIDESMNVLSGRTTQTTISLDMLRENTLYHFGLTARDLSGYDSNEVYSSFYTTLSKIENVTITDVTDSTVMLSWDKKEGATGYFVEVYNDFKVLLRKTAIENIIRGSTYTVTGLQSNSKYFFVLKPLNEEAVPYNGVELSEGEAIDPIAAVTLLSAPQKPDIRVTSTTAHITWPNVSGADGYGVYVGDKNLFEAAALYASVISNEFKISNLATGTTYFFWVVAHSNNVYSQPSPMTEVTTVTSETVVSFENPDDPVMDKIPEFISQVQQETHIILVDGTWDSIRWYVNGIYTASGSSFAINSHSLPIGSYELVVVVTKNGMPLSASLHFKVVN